MPSLTEAIQKKYTYCDTNDRPEDGSFVIFAPKAGARDCVPSTLVLNDFNVDSAGDVDQLANLCSKVEELDLSHNQLTDWIEIEKILQHAPRTKFVNLSFNDLSSIKLEGSSTLELQKLRSLVLIGTNVTWNTLLTLLRKACNLQELHLSLNNFQSVLLPKEFETKFCSVGKLMFEGNFLDDWDEIAKLGQIFPSLMHLSLANTPLHLTSDSEDIYKKFSALQILNLSGTLIETREEIGRLDKFPLLREVRLSEIPVVQEIPDKERRQELIAMLPKIRRLNGGAEISEDERDAAERYFIRKFLNSETKPQRYLELVQIHGQLDPLVEIKLKPVTEVTLKIKCGEQEVDQKVNLQISVRDLKKLLEPITGLQASRMELYHLDVGLNFGRDVLRFPNKQLYTYKMHDGDEIHVERRSKSNPLPYKPFATISE